MSLGMRRHGGVGLAGLLGLLLVACATPPLAPTAPPGPPTSVATPVAPRTASPLPKVPPPTATGPFPPPAPPQPRAAAGPAPPPTPTLLLPPPPRVSPSAPSAVPVPPLRASPTPPAPRPAVTCRETHGQVRAVPLASAVLGRRVAYSLYLPPCYGADPTRLYPALYLLPGANADHTQWPDLNVAPDTDQLIAQQAIAPLVVVMPDGAYQGGSDYAAFVLRDLIPQVEQTTRVARTGQQRALGGISRGGWWALTLAATHPDLFSAVGGHSPVTDAGLIRQFAGLPATRAPRIYLDVGQADSLAPAVQAFGQALTAQGWHPGLHLYPGTHTRPYWRAHTPEYLRFYAAAWSPAP